MSSLAGKLVARETGDRVALWASPHVRVTEAVKDYTAAYSTAYIYKIGATFEAQAIISNELSKRAQDDMLRISTGRVRQQVNEEVFGEFRRPLLDVIMVLQESRDAELAIEQLEKVLRYMFNDEPMPQMKDARTRRA